MDQPAGAGFSSGVWDYNENGVAEDFYDFLQEFYVQLPQYKNNSLYITGEQINRWSNIMLNSAGESYAGHYIPAISNHIFEKNQEDDDDYKIPLKGLAIGNGLTNTEIQYTTYPDMALDGGKVDYLLSSQAVILLYTGKSEGGSLQEGVITNKYGRVLFSSILLNFLSSCSSGHHESCS